MPKRLRFSQRIALAIIVVVMTFVSAIGYISYRGMYDVTYTNMNDALSFRAEVMSDHLTDKLNGIYKSVTEMSANTLIGNALVDDLGRDVYLVHFLSGFRMVEGLPVEVFVTDFIGRPIASNLSGAKLLPTQNFLTNAIDSNKARTFITERNDEYILAIVKPVLFANTGLPEGALIYQIPLLELLAQDEVLVHLKTSNNIGGEELSFRVEGQDAPGVIAIGHQHDPRLMRTYVLNVHPDMGGAGFTISVFGNPNPFKDLLEETLQFYAFVGALALLFAVATGLSISRVLTGRFKELQETALGIVHSGDVTERLPAGGGDEVSNVAGAFNAILDRLEGAYLDLEEQAELKLGKLRQAIEQSQVMVVITDIYGNIEYVNPEFEKTTGYSAEEAIGKNPRFLKSGNKRKDEYTELWHTITNGDKWNGEFLNKHKDGHLYWETASIAPIKDFEGEITGFIAVKENVTDRKEAEEALKIAKNDAEAANRAKSEFLSSMSHELRTPLNGILGFAQLLEQDPKNPLSKPQWDRADYIIKSGEHLLELINQVLELAQIEAGKLSVNLENLPICEVIEECIPIVRAMAEKRNVSVESDTAECANILVRADHTRLKQVFLNLLSNGVKYNRDGGSVTIGAHLTTQGQIRIAVTDTGLGIAKDKHEEIFVPFNRIGFEASNIEGTGIGLTITRKLLTLMNGEIGFESTEGKGSTFWVELPVGKIIDDAAPDKDAARSAGSFSLTAPIGHDGKRYSVLYVEDSPANMMLMEQIISMVPDLDLITAKTAERGVLMAQEQLPDLILMDINLPGMSGYDALRHLSESDLTRTIPVIAVSADALSHQIEEGLKAGFSAYLTKPLQINELLNKVRKILTDTA